MTILFVLLLVFLATRAEAVTYWVSKTLGSATTNCATASGATPPSSYLRTITEGKNCVKAGNGDIVYVRAGTYPEQALITSAQNGTAGNYTRFLRYPGDSKPIITAHPTCSALPPQSRPSPICEYNVEMRVAAYIEFDGFVVDAADLLGAQYDPVAKTGPLANSFGVNGSNHILFTNNEVKNCPTTCVTVYRQGPDPISTNGCCNVFRGNWIHDNWWDRPNAFVAGRGYFSGNAFYCTTNDNIFEFNTTGPNIGGIGIRGCMDTSSFESARNIVRYNTVYDFNVAGAAAGITAGSADNVIHHNTIYNPRNAGPAISVQDNNPTRTVIFNNTFYGVSHGIHFPYAGVSNTTVRNNIYYGSTGTPRLVFDESGVATGTVQSNNLCTPGALNCTGIFGNPSFTNPAAANFNLQAGSPAINAGTATITTGTGAISIFPCGTLPGCYNGPAPDMGALETGAPAAVVVTITTPTSNPTFITSDSGLNLGGTVK